MKELIQKYISTGLMGIALFAGLVWFGSFTDVRTANSATETFSPTPSPTESPTEPPDPCETDPLSASCGQVESRMEFQSLPIEGISLSGTTSSLDININRVAVNRPPTAVSRTLTTPVDSALNFFVSATDPEGDDLTYSIEIQPLHGSVTLNGTTGVYTPDSGYQGQDAFAFIASDGRRVGGGVITVRVGAQSNSPPVIQPLSFSESFGTIISINVSATDPEGGPLTSSINSDHIRGLLSGSYPNHTYNPDTVFGKDFFFVTVNESAGAAQRAIAIVEIEIAEPGAETAVYDVDPETSGATPVVAPTAGYGNFQLGPIDTTVYPEEIKAFYFQATDESGEELVSARNFQIDNTPPRVSFVNPLADDACVGPRVQFVLDATDNVSVRDVLMNIPGLSSDANLSSTEFGYSIDFDTTILGSEGRVPFGFYALDSASLRSPTVVKPLRVDVTAPTLSFTSPSAGQIVRGAFLDIELSAADNLCGLAEIQLLVPDGEGGTINAVLTTEPYRYRWDIRNLTDGNYSVHALAIDTVGNVSEPISVSIIIRNANQPPMANAGPDLTVNENAVVMLDGSLSDDPENATLDFSWTQISGPAIVLENTDTPTPSFVAPYTQPDRTRTLIFELRVFDGLVWSEPDRMAVFVEDAGIENQEPIPPAIDPIVIREQEVVNIGGSPPTDPEGDNFTYQWTQISGPEITFNDSTIRNPSFTAPFVNETTLIQIQLVVTDEFGAKSGPVEVNIEITDAGDDFPNQRPMASAGLDFSADENATVQLDASASSDPEGEDLTYQWRQTAGIPINLELADTVRPQFHSPFVAGPIELVFELVVEDLSGLVSVSDFVMVTINDTISGNHSPTADAGADLVVKEGQRFTLWSTGSRDPEGMLTAYEWRIIEGPVLPGLDVTAAEQELLSPLVQDDTQITFELVVRDELNQESEPSRVTVTVINDKNVSLSLIEPDLSGPIWGSQTISAQISNLSDLTFQQLQLHVGQPGTMEFKASGQGSVLNYQWDTILDGIPDGEIWIRIRALFEQDRVLETWHLVTVDNRSQTPPPEIVLNEIQNQDPEKNYLRGTVNLAADVTGSVDLVSFFINGTEKKAELIDGKYRAQWDSAGINGDVTIKVVATGLGGTTETEPITRTVDNTKPVIKWEQDFLNKISLGAYGNQPFRVEATDNHDIKSVSFLLGISTIAVDTEGLGDIYEFILDTSLYEPVDGYTMLARATDRAGNTKETSIISFEITNNPPRSPGVRSIHPADKSIVVKEAESRIYLDLNTPLDPDTVKENSIRVQAIKDGKTTDVPGITEYQEGQLRFIGDIPSNAEIIWSISNVYDTDNKLIDGQYRFIRYMDNTVGGTVRFEKNGREVRIVIPPDALPEAAHVKIDLLTPKAISDRDIKESNSDELTDIRDVIGPLDIYALDKNGIRIPQLNIPAVLTYLEHIQPQDPEEQARIIQIQGSDGLVWRPLDQAAPGTLAGDPPGARSLSVNFMKFSLFRIASIAAPGLGVTSFFNFPNPFSPHENGGTSLHYMLGADSDIKIFIYDLFGNLVRKLEFSRGSLYARAGQNIFLWNGRNGEGEAIGNGGYIIHLVAEDAQGNRSTGKRKVGVVK